MSGKTKPMLPNFSFDFGDRYMDVNGFQVAFRVYSESNVYTPDPARIKVLRQDDGLEIEADRFSWAGLQQQCKGSFRASIQFIEGGFECAIYASLPERIKGTAILLLSQPPSAMPTRDYAFEPIIAENSRLRYPADMRLPIFPLEMQGGEYLAVASLDEKVRGKTVAVASAPPNEPDLCCIELHHHEDARFWSTRQSTPTWRVVKTDNPQPLFDERMRLMEKEWGLSRWEERRDVPQWAREIGLVLNLHGAHWTGYVFNTYQQQLDALRYVCERIEGRRVLAWLAAWDGRYNFNWPGYEPDEAMGGAAGLRALVEGAHELSVHVIPQLGAVSANRRFLPPALHDAGAQDAYGNELVKPIDWDYDHTPDTYRVNANIGHPGFRQFLFDKTCRLVEEFGFDGVFLDINMMWQNDPRFHVLEGHLKFARMCHERFDDFLIFGENWYDGLLSAYPLVHSVYAPGKGVPQKWPQCFHRYARATYHLIHPAPGAGSTGVYEYGFQEPFVPDPQHHVIPAISFVDDTLPKHRSEIDLRIEAAKEYIKRMEI